MNNVNNSNNIIYINNINKMNNMNNMNNINNIMNNKIMNLEYEMQRSSKYLPFLDNRIDTYK